MLHPHRSAANLLLFCLTAGAVAIGCFFNSAEDCERNPILDCFSSGAVSSSGGDDASPPPVCDPSADNPIIADECGVFVSSTLGDDAADGSKANPLKTLAAAIDKASAQGTRVYACAEELQGSVTLSTPLTIHGGFDCKTNWTYVGLTMKSTLLSSPDEIALTLTKPASGAKLIDFIIRSRSATKEGVSSIAVLADAVTAELVRCKLIAGSGAKGVTGAHGDPNGAPALPGTSGNDGKNACSDLAAPPGPDTKIPGGDQIIKDCTGDITIGGSGGDGNILNGGGGDDGQVGPAGLGGKGQPAAGLWSCIEGAGQIGASGDSGIPGAPTPDFGTISPAGYLAPPAGAGTPGKPGQGGGGGGGAKGGNICSGGASGAGASGGSGGSGGCGGLPGQGGGPGGASIALLSINASITLTDTSLRSGPGGTGGSGGDLQPGGSGGDAGKGGQGAAGSKPACAGGQGGSGGDGGPGAGGNGGPSFGIAYKGTPPTRLGATEVTPADPGKGGLGGSVNVAQNPGSPGTSAEEIHFPD